MKEEKTLVIFQEIENPELAQERMKRLLVEVRN
jgi:hypothetical protein